MIKYFVSPYRDIFQNLALEDVLLRQVEEDYLFFYRNDPCFVLGKFQNIFQEIHLAELSALKIPIARRQSGGGGVYHDRGNLCFSHIYQKQGKSLELKKVADFNSEVIRIFADASLVVQTSDRHDLKLKKNEEFYKFSGQAFKQTKNRVLHHGTLLWDADLEVLDRLCHFKDPEEISSKAIRSLKSIVLNLNSLDLFAETQSFSSYFFEKSSWKLEEINIRPIIKQYEEAIIQAYATYKSKDWVYDRNPKFSIKHSFKDDEVIYSFKGVELVAIKSSLGRNYSWSSGLLGLKLIQNDFQKFFHDLKESSNASAELNLVQGFLSYYVLRN